MNNFDIMYAHEHYFNKPEKKPCDCCGLSEEVDELIQFAPSVYFCRTCTEALHRKMPTNLINFCKEEITNGDQSSETLNFVILTIRYGR